MYVILCVIDDTRHLDAVVRSLHTTGVSGLTILESTGLHRHLKQVHIPMRYAFGTTVPKSSNNTLMMVVETEEDIQKCLKAVEDVIGDFRNHHTGIFMSWPLGFTKGIGDKLPYDEEKGGERG